MKKLLALLMAVTLTFQLVTPVFAEEIEETQTATEAVEVETEAPTTEIPTTEPTTTDAMETAAPEETSAPTEPQPTTELTEATETTASTEETTVAATEPTEETTEPALDLFAEDGNVIASGTCGADGDNLTWVLTKDGTLTISGSGAMRDFYTHYIWPNLLVTTVILDFGVTSIGRSAFRNCSNLTSVTIPEGVMSIGSGAFDGCSSLTSVTIPEGVMSIGSGAFDGCSSLTSVTIPKSVTKIEGGTFHGCTKLESVTLPEGLLSIGYYSGDGALEDCTSLKNIEIPDSVTSIGGSAFAGCSSLTSVNIPDSVTVIGNSAFDGCSSLTSVTIPEGVTSIGSQTFHGCSSLTSVTIPDSVTSINGTFSGCSSLKSVTIPEGVTHIGASAFSGCSSLTSVTIPDSVISIGEFSFCGCASLTSVTIPDSVTNIGFCAFAECSSLTSAVLSASVTSIEVNVFCDCSSLTSVTIPEGVTSIGGSAFYGCVRLESVVIPRSVMNVSLNAFWNCRNLKKVYYGGSEEDWNKIQISDGNSALNRAKRYCNVTELTTEIRSMGTGCLVSGSKVALTAWAMPDNKKVKANWSLASGDEAYASISSSGVLTAKNVNEVQNITVIATPTDGSPEARKEIQILPKITVKQAEKFNLFHSYSRAELVITGGKVDCALLDGNKDFVLENENDHFYIRFANPDNPPAKPNTRATLQVFFPGSDTPATKVLTISTTNAAPKLKLNPTSSILNTKLIAGLTVEAEVLGTEDESLKARSATNGVTATVESGKLVVTLDTAKTTTATIYLKGNDWAKEVKLTHRITVTNKQPTVKFTAKGKLDVLNPASEIVYTPKLTNAAGTVESVRLEGQDANLFNAEVVDGLVHLKLAKSGENYATKKTYKVTPIVTLLGKDITGPTLSVKVTQSTMKLAKIPNQTVSKSSPEDLTVNIKIISPANAEIGDVQLNAKTTAALRTALETAGGINFEADTVTFPAPAFAALKPGKYTVILDVTPANAAGDTKPIQAKFTLTVQK